MSLCTARTLRAHIKEGPEGVKWELGFAYFWVGKWDFMHWDSSAKKQ
jgi:hypothetical protein